MVVDELIVLLPKVIVVKPGNCGLYCTKGFTGARV